MRARPRQTSPRLICSKLDISLHETDDIGFRQILQALEGALSSACVRFQKGAHFSNISFCCRVQDAPFIDDDIGDNVR